MSEQPPVTHGNGFTGAIDKITLAEIKLWRGAVRHGAGSPFRYPNDAQQRASLGYIDWLLREVQRVPQPVTHLTPPAGLTRDDITVALKSAGEALLQDAVRAPYETQRPFGEYAADSVERLLTNSPEAGPARMADDEVRQAYDQLGATLDRDFGFWSAPTTAPIRSIVWNVYVKLGRALGQPASSFKEAERL